MKVAIVRRNGLGDLLSVMPLVMLLKERYVGCHVTLFVDGRNAPLLPYLRGFDESVVIEPSSNKYVSLLKTLWKHRHRSFDLAISARPTPMQWSNLLLAGLQTSHRRAVVDGGWHARWIDEPREYDPQAHYHQMVKGLRLLDDSIEEVPHHLLPRIDVRPSRQFDKRCLLVSVSNHRIGSQLDSDKIARHLNRAFEQYDFHVVLNCEPSDLKRAHDVAKELRMTHEVVVTPNFQMFMELLASVDGSWTGDGGIMHLVAALDKPQLVLFGKTELWEWAPLSKKARCLRDPANVNFIAEDSIQQALEELISELR